jgi:hypothetical protein
VLGGVLNAKTRVRRLRPSPSVQTTVAPCRRAGSSRAIRRVRRRPRAGTGKDKGPWEPGDLASCPTMSRWTSGKTTAHCSVTAWLTMRWHAYPFHYAERSWQRAGSVRAGRLAPRPGDETVHTDQRRTWPLLADELDAPPPRPDPDR